MAHEITETDGVFSVREEMWHGLGTVLADYPTVEEAKKIAHNWEPVSEPVYRQVPFITADGEPDVRFEVIPESVLNVRSDNAASLGVVGKDYTPVSNAEMYEIAEAIEGTEKGSVMLETGGSLRGGRSVWLLLRLREPITVKGDPNGTAIAYYALQNNHDGGGAFRGQGTNVRIVCANTSRAADLDASARGTEFTFRHTKNVAQRIEEARTALAGWRESVQQWRLANEALIATRITTAQAELFIEHFVPMPPARAVSDRVVENIEQARGQIRKILAGPTCEGIDRTAYGLVAAASEYHQHVRAARSAESRFKRAYLDKQQILTDAVDIALDVAKV